MIVFRASWSVHACSKQYHSRRTTAIHQLLSLIYASRVKLLGSGLLGAETRMLTSGLYELIVSRALQGYVEFITDLVGMLAGQTKDDVLGWQTEGSGEDLASKDIIR
jgi:hypothetical protein